LRACSRVCVDACIHALNLEGTCLASVRMCVCVCLCAFMRACYGYRTCCTSIQPSSAFARRLHHQRVRACLHAVRDFARSSAPCTHPWKAEASNPRSLRAMARLQKFKTHFCSIAPVRQASKHIATSSPRQRVTTRSVLKNTQNQRATISVSNKFGL
jgi:hypothetical protein